MSYIKNTASALVAVASIWLFVWAMAYVACVGTYHSSACKQDLTSQVVFTIIGK